MPSSLNWIFTVSESSFKASNLRQTGRRYLQDGRAQDRSRCHRGRGRKTINPVTVLPVTDGQVSSERSVILPILLVAPW
jgi:hypothetical protein